MDGDFDPASGMVHSAMKGRGIGDCWWVRQWQFDGQGFVLRSESGRRHVPWICGRRLAVADLCNALTDLLLDNSSPVHPESLFFFLFPLL